MRTVAIIPARFDSARLPGKALRDVEGKPMLARLIERVMRSDRIDDVLVATTTLDSDDAVVKVAEEAGARWFRGSERDVLGRIVASAEDARADTVVEIMGDSPLVHRTLIDAVLDRFDPNRLDFVCSYTPTVKLPEHGESRAAFPVGIWVEAFKLECMQVCEREYQDAFAREHSTTSLYRNPGRFRLDYLEADGEWEEANRPDLFLAVNTAGDFDLVNAVFGHELQRDPDFGVIDAIRACDELRPRQR